MLAQTRSTLAAAREGVRQMDGYTSDARWALSQVAVLRRREQVGRGVGTALHELAEVCETAAQIGRVVDRHLRLVIEDVQEVDHDQATFRTEREERAERVARMAVVTT